MRRASRPVLAVTAAFAAAACLSACSGDASTNASAAADKASTAASKAGAAASSAATEAASNAATAADSASAAASTAAADASSAAAQATDITGRYTLAQVKTHSTPNDCWAAIDGTVYNLTSWIGQHPGGPAPIQGLCGTDATAAFTGKHGAEAPDGRPQHELAGFKVGTLAG